MKTLQLRNLSLLILAAMIFLNSNLFAQPDDEKQPPPGQDNDRFGPPHMVKPPMHKKGHSPDIPDLSEEQKEQIKELEINHMKEVLPMNNQLGEKEARLRTLSTEDEADINAINTLIEDIGKIKIEMMKKEAAFHQGIRKIFTSDQRVLFDLGPQHHDKHPKMNK